LSTRLCWPSRRVIQDRGAGEVTLTIEQDDAVARPQAQALHCVPGLAFREDDPAGL
jgi:hypothetical protein